MRITVLTVPGCPNAAPALAQVTAALAGRTAEIESVEVLDQNQASVLGMAGSPTILLDGVDPFAAAETAPSVSCRLYRGADGTVAGVPSEDALRQAIDNAELPQPAAADDCCESDALDAVGRGGRGRRAPDARGLRAMHQAVLREFAATGTAPAPDELESIASEAGRRAREVMEELAREDFLTLDEQGRIRAAYPFSATETRHRVRIDGGAEVWSMCAIDALGIPAMLNRDAEITSTDPVTGEPIAVTTRNGTTTWEPADAVVFVGQRPGGGPAATACCDALNFFRSHTTARAWISEHPEVPGRIVEQAQAEEIAARTFGPVLASGSS